MSGKRWIRIILVLVVGALLLAFSNYPQGDELQRIRAFSRPLEFDYVGWTLNALGTKLGQVALPAHLAGHHEPAGATYWAEAGARTTDRDPPLTTLSFSKCQSSFTTKPSTCPSR